MPTARHASGLIMALTVLLIPGLAAQQAEDLEIEAGFHEVDGRAGIALYRDDVTFRHREMRVQAEEMQAHELEPGVFDYAILTGGPVTFVVTPEDGPRTEGQADRIAYDFQEQHLTLEGNAQLTQPGRSMSAGRIEYNMATEHIRAQQGDDGDGRVRTRFVPESDEDEENGDGP